MAYSKQTWTDDVSTVTGARMTHIEQGIYDNSLATDKINPSGTATTTAEIEEGQINDVIGFKSLKLKGQTSQYTTTGKQLLYGSEGSKTSNGITFTENTEDGSIRINGTATANATFEFFDKTWTEFPSGTYRLSGAPTGSTTSTYRLVCWKEGWTVLGTDLGNGATITLSEATNIRVQIVIASGTTLNNIVFKPMLETGSTTHEWEKYSGGKASPNPDFPQEVNNVSGYNVVRISNKNLYDKDDSNLIMNNVYINPTGYVLTAANNMKTICMPCKPNTAYVVSKVSSARFVIGSATSNTTGTSMTTGRNNFTGTQLTLTTGANDKYLFVFYYNSSADTKTEQEIRNSIQVEIGSSATSFVAHQGNNFELNFTKNLFDSEKYLENASISNNTIVSTNNNNLFYIPVQYGRNYTFSFVDNGVSGNILYGFSNDKPVIGGACTYNILDITQLNKHTFTPVSTNNKYLCIRLNVVNTNQYLAMENIQVEVGNQATEYIAYNENPIELCKIGTYQDYIYKKDGKWFKHKEVGKVVWNGTESWQNNAGISTTYVIARPSDLAQANNNVFYNYFSTVADLSVATEGARIGSSINLKNPNTADLASFKTWLGTNNVEMYYQSTTPTDEEITYAPLLRQLDEVYNSGLYEVTNISQDNSSEAFILDFEACKNNINGIVEYIRR